MDLVNGTMMGVFENHIPAWPNRVKTYDRARLYAPMPKVGYAWRGKSV
jgi:hypothetical protein